MALKIRQERSPGIAGQHKASFQTRLGQKPNQGSAGAGTLNNQCYIPGALAARWLRAAVWPCGSIGQGA